MIETRDLVHRYDSMTAVDRVSISIPDGTFCVLCGPNGSGKTTLIRHFNGLLSPDAGSVRVNDIPVEDDLVAARTAVGMTFQDPRDGFVAATVGEDVAFGPENLGLDREEIDHRVCDALAAVRMEDCVDERIDRLSGGEQARVAIAGTLAMEPDHLVLDEPFAGLDEPARRSVLDRLTALHANSIGVIVVTHDLRTVIDLADRIVVMTNGRIVLDAPPEEAVEHLPALDVRVPC
jgi:biotin transport system ATP-binding protein